MSAKSTARRKRRDLVNGGEPEGPSRSGGFWTQWIEPKGAALLSQTLRPSHFVIKNHGPSGVKLLAEYGDLMDLGPGQVRATYANGTVTVQNRGEKSMLIEFEFLPLLKL